VGRHGSVPGRVRQWREDKPGGLAVIDIPGEAVGELGGRRQMPMVGALNGVPFSGSTMLVAGGGFCVGVSRGALRSAGVGTRWTSNSSEAEPRLPGRLRQVTFSFEAELWVWDARRADSWTFVSLPESASAEIRDMVGSPARPGFGSVRVRATIGSSTWATSVFPDGPRGTYSLPVKRSVRRAEGLSEGDVVPVTVEVADP
jgi:Domain of unknown function (DUF1905)